MTAVKKALATPAEAGPIVSGEDLEGVETVDITSPHDRRVVVGTCRAADPPAIDRALTAAKCRVSRLGRNAAARPAPRSSTAPPICSRPTAPR